MSERGRAEWAPSSTPPPLEVYLVDENSEEAQLRPAARRTRRVATVLGGEARQLAHERRSPSVLGASGQHVETQHWTVAHATFLGFTSCIIYPF